MPVIHLRSLPLTFDAETGLLSNPETQTDVRLSGRQKQLFSCLVRANGRSRTNEEIADDLKIRYDDETIRKLISQTRKTILSVYDKPEAVLQNERGSGYFVEIRSEGESRPDAPALPEAIRLEYERADHEEFNLDAASAPYEAYIPVYQTYRRIALVYRYPKAVNDLGRMYLFGKGCGQDQREAFRCFEEAAQSGYAPAQLNLGELYQRGLGTEPDAEKAVYWYRQAAENPSGGDRDAMYRLHLCLKDGIGTAPDAAEAREWQYRAMEQGVSYYADYIGSGLRVAARFRGSSEQT